jgi:hypothetical protein
VSAVLVLASFGLAVAVAAFQYHHPHTLRAWYLRLRVRRELRKLEKKVRGTEVVSGKWEAI